ncbi:MAG TPA: HAD family phosphatase [Bacteroidales bacterium]|nr:MAG: hypothetical protein A2X11_10455 [Bacteroidetes bacterium GWE2_42_24]OFY32623.1 MAG: hypothetical protein A2X09_02515 [Bacteroidetes bacterium GWF2_43_11]HAQ65207.1 HAD family phosphatase [Bacteroidales bacterium]HBZ65545.1 HAD family phosphatase [Bacteroidales bacterium]
MNNSSRKEPLKPFHNIIFDFGGVFLNIDFRLTFQAFSQLSDKPFEMLFPDGFGDELLLHFETGKVSPIVFRNELRERLGKRIDDTTLDVVWNALLLDLPGYRVDLLKKVAAHYRVFLLSNTNIIHYQKYNSDFRDRYGFDFCDLFKKAYWSHELGLRKPDLACFEAVIKDSGIDASETVFIDDSYPNVEGARKAGLQAIHLTTDVVELFEDGVIKKELF